MPSRMEVTLSESSTIPPRGKFPTIQPDMVNRLSKEADMRTIQPQTVDWEEIHRQAAEARKKG